MRSTAKHVAPLVMLTMLLVGGRAFSPRRASAQVLLPAVLTKDFVNTNIGLFPIPPTLPPAGVGFVVFGTQVWVRFTVTNPNAVGDYTSVSFTDALPLGMTVGPTGGLNGPFFNCANQTVAITGSSSISVNFNFGLPATGKCAIVIPVVVTGPGTYPNTTSTVLAPPAAPGNSSSATLVVTAPPVASTPTPVSTAIPTPIVTPAPVVIPVVPVVPQGVQNPAIGGIFNGPRSNTPTPQPVAVAPALGGQDPLAAIFIQPPRTGDAGLAN